MASRKHQQLLSPSRKASVLYHNIFDYPLTKEELSIWEVNRKAMPANIAHVKVDTKNNFYFLQGRQNLITRRLRHEQYSLSKLLLAAKAGKYLEKLPSILFIGITGSLAMHNAGKNSDIDLMIITKKNSLWTTRFLVYILLFLTGFQLRTPHNKNEKDRLCLNIWLDETDLVWLKQNIFIAHELAQIKPLVNKNKTYERLLRNNRWILNFWPRSVNIPKKNNTFSSSFSLPLLEKLLFLVQYTYMKSKITSETITSTKALFHPHDWSPEVEAKLSLKSTP